MPKISINIRMFKGVDTKIAGMMLREQGSEIQQEWDKETAESRHFGLLSNPGTPAGRIFVGPKRGHVRGKEDVWSPYCTGSGHNQDHPKAIKQCLEKEKMEKQKYLK